jgi:hypothetical protein
MWTNRILPAVGAFVLFAYFEKVYHAGAVVSLLLGTVGLLALPRVKRVIFIMVGVHSLATCRSCRTLVAAVAQIIVGHVPLEPHLRSDFAALNKQISYCIFVVVLTLFAITRPKDKFAVLDHGSSDMHIEFRPFEKVTASSRSPCTQ